MGAPKRPRRGSLQFYPRKRVSKLLPSVNWSGLDLKPQAKGILGFITYKVGMGTALVKDTTDKSMTLNKKIYIPATVLEAPNMKVYSVRFYKNSKVLKDIVVSSDPVLKRIVKVSKKPISHNLENAPKEFDDVRIIVYSIPSQAKLKKTPDMIELAVNADNKIEYIKSLLNKEIPFTEFLNDKVSLLDIRGLTTGKGFSGPMKRYGVGRRSHKAEKGVRSVGSIGPWHPAHITFRVPNSGQLGMFTRLIYNIKVLKSGKISETNINPKNGFKHYGNINSNFIIVKGSVQGPAKRQILITLPQRPTRHTVKQKLEFQELLA
jgi:large subunit ribosomal protein L3